MVKKEEQAEKKYGRKKKRQKIHSQSMELVAGTSNKGHGLSLVVELEDNDSGEDRVLANVTLLLPVIEDELEQIMNILPTSNLNGIETGINPSTSIVL